MKYLSIILLFISFGLNGQILRLNPVYLPPVTTEEEDPSGEIRIAQYKFEQNGTDSYGELDMTATGTVEYVSFGAGYLFSYAASNGDSGFDNYLTSASIDFGDHFTVSFWVNADALDQDYPLIMAGTLNGFFIYWNPVDGIISVRTSNGTNTLTALSSDCNPTLNTDSHIAVTFNRASGTCKIYFNGTDYTSATDDIRTDFDNTVAICPGWERPYTDVTSSGYQIGMIDEVQLYNVELTSSEVTWIQTHSTTMVTR